MNTNLIAPPKPGIYAGIAPEVYFRWDACSNSWLKKISISPAHLLDVMERPQAESTDSQVIGSAVHCMVLEPDYFGERYAVREEGVKGTTKAGKAFKAQAEVSGAIVLSDKDYRWCRAIADRAKHNPLVSEWLHAEHKTEVSLVWDRDGYMCKARLDLMVPGQRVIPDLKTTKTASQQGFANQIAKYKYHCQGAWYLSGMRELTDNGSWDFWLIAAEKRRPFLVSCHRLAFGSTALAIGQQESDAAFELYKECRQSGKWPGYGDSFDVELPAWAVGKESEVEVPFDI